MNDFVHYDFFNLQKLNGGQETGRLRNYLKCNKHNILQFSRIKNLRFGKSKSFPFSIKYTFDLGDFSTFEIKTRCKREILCNIKRI